MDRLKNPGYFVIVPSFSRTPLLIARRSHRYIWQTTAQKKLMQEEFPVEMIFIPPWSIFIGRGDLRHAGAAFKDGPVTDIEKKSLLLRYHMYFIRVRPN